MELLKLGHGVFTQLPMVSSEILTASPFGVTEVALTY